MVFHVDVQWFLNSIHFVHYNYLLAGDGPLDSTQSRRYRIDCGTWSIRGDEYKFSNSNNSFKVAYCALHGQKVLLCSIRVFQRSNQYRSASSYVGYRMESDESNLGSIPKE